MLVTTIIVCSTLVFYFGNQLVDTLAAGVATLADVVVASIMPYLFAAAIAGMSAMAITTILPTAQSIEPQEKILQRLRQSKRRRPDGEGQDPRFGENARISRMN